MGFCFGSRAVVPDTFMFSGEYFTIYFWIHEKESWRPLPGKSDLNPWFYEQLNLGLKGLALPESGVSRSVGDVPKGDHSKFL
jgi:hypothetical protein